MNTNQTIDGVPRDYVLRLTPQAHSVVLGMVEHCLNVRACMGMDEGFKDFDTEEEHDFVKELRALVDGPACKVCNDTKQMHEPGQEPGSCAACFDESAEQPQPDQVLCKFYDVTDYPGLVRELVGHVAQLQDSARRNVKPWEDTFPPTLLPAYIERVNAENAAAPPQGEQVAHMPVERCYDVRAKMIIAFNEAKKAGGDLDDALDAAYKSALRYSPNPLSSEQPAPVAVVPSADPERERLMEIVQQYPNVDPLEYDAAVRTLRK